VRGLGRLTTISKTCSSSDDEEHDDDDDDDDIFKFMLDSFKKINY